MHLTQEEFVHKASRWLPSHQIPRRFRVHTDTTNFFQVEYDDILLLRERPYLIRHNAKELRFGLEDEVKFWVKRAIDLEDGQAKIIKLVFYEKYMAHVGDITFECFRSPRKEARILELVNGKENFMHGFSVKDEKGNIIRVLDFIQGKTLSSFVGQMEMEHETYFHEQFPEILANFLECVQSILFLHENGEKHGDIRRDHILIDSETGRYRWIDFDYNYRHRENIYGYDLFGLGNILVFLVGMGDVLLQNLQKSDHPVLKTLDPKDMNIIFTNRVVNLKKVYPYIPDSLNRVLLHFSRGSHWFYEHTGQLIEDLSLYMDTRRGPGHGGCSEEGRREARDG
jgi:serine/threonine protein kinase